LPRWGNHFSQIWNVHGVNYVRQREINTAETIVSESSVCEADMAIEKLKRHKLSGIDHIPTELIKAWGRTIRSGIHNLINICLE